MRSIFPGYYRPTPEQFRELWNKCIFVFDTNVLLDLYRYPEQTREELLQLFHQISDRVWLPFQVALEYQENRLSVITEQIRRYDDVKKILQETQTKLNEEMNRLQLKKRHSVINPDELLRNISDNFNAFLRKVDSLRERQLDITDDDEIRNQLDKLFAGRIGKAPVSQSVLDEIYKRGKERYEKAQPPGYKDESKAKADDSIYHYQDMVIKHQFGDLILWFQLIEWAKEAQISHIIFVTNDEKEDWWWLNGKKTVGPRRELIEEIYQETSVELFYMYNTEQFLRYATEQFKVQVSDVSIEQVRDITEVQIENDGFTIIRASSIFGSPIDNLEKILGQPIESHFRDIGGAEELPDGGESRTYTMGTYQLCINYDKSGTAKGFQIIDGLLDHNYTLEHWPVILSRIGMAVIKQPDIAAPTARHWKNYLGYGISIYANKLDGPVWGIRIYQLPKQ